MSTLGVREAVDAHVHVWDLAARPQPWIDPASMAAIDRSFEPGDLRDALRSADVPACVLVQVLNVVEETTELLEHADRMREVTGVVGWADLLAPDLADQVAALRDHRGGDALVGIRHQAQVEPDPGSWLRALGEGSALDVLADEGLVCELMMRPAQLAVVHDVVVAHPATPFVLDHAGKPPIDTGWSESARAWAESMRRLGRLPNLVCKLSGLTTMARQPDWSVRDIRPFAEELLNAFGPGRLVYGSDWPVSLRAGAYDRTIATALELLSGCSQAEVDQVMGGTARSVYGLSPAGTPRPDA